MACEGLAPHYQIELTSKGPMDAMTIHVEALPQYGGADAKAAASKTLSDRIKGVVGISATINVCDSGGIDRSQGKAVRVIDKRDK